MDLNWQKREEIQELWDVVCYGEMADDYTLVHAVSVLRDAGITGYDIKMVGNHWGSFKDGVLVFEHTRLKGIVRDLKERELFET